jgi:hypothetical protein
MKTRFVASVLLFAGRAGAAPQHATVPCEVLTPVLNAQHTVATAPAPDGKSYPVFRAAPASQLLEGVRHELDGSFAQQALRLDRYARNLITTRREKARASVEEWLTAPMYLLMSTEEGGFARFGFWLEDAAGKRTLVKAGYVDLVISQRSIDSGDFEEIFPHELGHLVLKALTGGFASGQSRKMHRRLTRGTRSIFRHWRETRLQIRICERSQVEPARLISNCSGSVQRTLNSAPTA